MFQDMSNNPPVSHPSDQAIGLTKNSSSVHSAHVSTTWLRILEYPSLRMLERILLIAT